MCQCNCFVAFQLRFFVLANQYQPPPTHTHSYTHTTKQKNLKRKFANTLTIVLPFSIILSLSLPHSSALVFPFFHRPPPTPSIPSHPTQHFKRNKSIKLKTTTTTATNYDTNSLVCYFAGQDVFQCFSFPVLFFDSRFAAIFLRLRPSPPPTFPETLFDDDDDDKGDDD